MRNFANATAAGLLLAAVIVAATAQGSPAARPLIQLEPIGTHASGVFNVSAAEIVAHDPGTQRLFVVSAASGKIDVLDVQDPTTPILLFAIEVDGIANSVAVHRGLVAVAVEAAVKTDAGQAAFFDAHGNALGAVTVGALPDMITFTPDGKRVLVANEGEPNNDYTVDPEGSVSIIDLPNAIAALDQSHVRTARFTGFDGVALDPSIRIFGPGASVSQDLEPEYITVSDDSTTAWVALQENNAIATLDIASGDFTALRGLGFKDHLAPGNELDVSDQDGAIRIANWPAFGMYQPDSIASFRHQGRAYIVTANEGDARDYAGYSEEARFRALSGATPICSDAPRFTQFLENNDLGIVTIEQLRLNSSMGRLTVTSANGLRADGSCFDEIYAFGARSFSIWTEDLELVYDSGSEFERTIAAVNPANFNANHTANGAEPRSDDKGPEPEALVVAKLWGHTYAFIGLERVGGIMVYDITEPAAPVFVQYLNNRDFGVAPASGQAGDLGPEGFAVIEAAKSAIPGVPLLVLANEVSGTTTLYRIDQRRDVR